MLSTEQIVALAKTRLEEAQTLHDNRRFDGSVYLCGYAIEISLKTVVLKERLWGFPEDDEEFKLYMEVKTHDLDKLLKVAQKDSVLLNEKVFAVAWNTVKSWRSEFRYRPIGAASEQDSLMMIASTRDIMSALGIV